MFVYYVAGKFDEKCMICFRSASICVEASDHPRVSSGLGAPSLSVQQFYCQHHEHEAGEYDRRLKRLAKGLPYARVM